MPSPAPSNFIAEALVLAGGASERFGGGKLRHPFQGKPLLLWAVKAALASNVRAVTIVLGADERELTPLLVALQEPRLSIIACAHWQEGIAASLSCGIASLPDDVNAAVIFLGDMPHISSDTANTALTMIGGGASAVMPVFENQPAHPVAISCALFQKLMGLKGDTGARAVLRAEPNAVELAITDPGSVFDVDLKDDLCLKQGS